MSFRIFEESTVREVDEESIRHATASPHDDVARTDGTVYCTLLMKALEGAKDAKG